MEWKFDSTDSGQAQQSSVKSRLRWRKIMNGNLCCGKQPGEKSMFIRIMIKSMEGTW
jgi:hypothetical protein